MVAVFSIFGTLSMLIFKQCGVGLAAATDASVLTYRDAVTRLCPQILSPRAWAQATARAGLRV